MNPQLEELACFYVLDRLDAGERAAFEARLPHDAQLAALVHELEAALARRIHALPLHEPPADLLARIEHRIEIRPADPAGSRPARPALPRWVAFARWGLAAVIALSLATLAIQSLRHAPRVAGQPVVLFVGLNAQQSTLTELPLTGRPQTADARFVQLAALAEHYWDKPAPLSARPASAGTNGRGYALFDPGSNQGFIAIQQLPAIAPGERYHLWILDPATAQTRDAGALPLGGSSRGLYFFTVAPAEGSAPARPAFFVTAEDDAAPASLQPHGKVVLGDKRL